MLCTLQCTQGLKGLIRIKITTDPLRTLSSDACAMALNRPTAGNRFPRLTSGVTR